jgi:CRP-like cAMP-binding protein
MDLTTNMPKTKPHAIDFVGFGTFQVSQLDVLQKRSIENSKSAESVLSARGLHHRNKAFFTKEVKAASAVIQQTLLQGVKDPKNNGQGFYLQSQYFQRALGFERLHQIDRAIEDYGRCISITPHDSASYFNRGGLLLLQGKLEEATNDYDKAVELNPTNTEYLDNRALLYRRRGMFTEATQDMLTSRTIKAKNASAGLDIDKSMTTGLTVEDDDPVLVYLKRPYLDRQERQSELVYVIDFLKGVKFFAGIINNTNIMRVLASKVKLAMFNKDEVIFREGDIGTNFYIIIDGEVSIVKYSGNDGKGNPTKRTVLVKLFRSQTFGETALNSVSGLRSAGAECSQKAHILTLEVSDYNYILSSYRGALRTEIRDVLQSCAVFKTWEHENLEMLAEAAAVKSYTAQSVIIKTGESVNQLFIVRRGIVKLVKEIPQPNVGNIKIDELATPGSDLGMENPGLWVLKKNWKDVLQDESEMLPSTGDSNSLEFTVGVLGSGQVFGELAVLSPVSPHAPLPSPTTAISFTNAEVYCFEANLLETLGAKFNAESINVLNESLNLYNPPCEKIGHFYRYIIYIYTMYIITWC